MSLRERSLTNREARSGRWVMVSMGLLALLTFKPEQANGQTKEKFDPSKVRAEMDAVRQKLEADRRMMELSRQEFDKGRLDFDKAFELQARQVNHRPKLAYQLRSGQQFAYQVFLEWSTVSLTHRVVSMPFYQVRYEFGSNQSRKKAVMALAHYQHYVKGDGDAHFRLSARGDYWSHPALIFESRGIASYGHDEFGEIELPYLLKQLVSINHFVFPPLPYNVDGKLYSDSPAVVQQTRNGVTLWTGFTSSSGGTGRVRHSTVAQPAGNSVVKLEILHAFNQGLEDFSAVYETQGRFDLTEGLLTDSQGTYTLKDGNESTEVTIIVKRLFGAEFEKAKQTAIADLRNAPQDVVPVEFNRQQVELFLPHYFTVNELPAVNQQVGYYDDRMDQYFVVTFLERLNAHDAKVRFEGSGETIVVPPGKLCQLSP